MRRNARQDSGIGVVGLSQARTAAGQEILMQTIMLNVGGMKCGGCVNKLSLALNRIVGVSDVQISLASGAATVRYDEHRTSPAGLHEAVIASGFGIDGMAATNGHDPRPDQCG